MENNKLTQDFLLQLKRIADALEEVLRLVKEDQQRTKKYLEKEKS